MNFYIKQDAKCVDELKWNWSVWLEGDDKQLDEVKEVSYLLHSTFKNRNPVRSSRANKFRLNSAGWGSFTIYAEVRMKDGGVVQLEHYLRLVDTGEQAAAQPRPRGPRVLVSYSVGDAPYANQICNALLQKGVNVVATDGPQSEEEIDGYDAAVVVMPKRLTPWMDREIAMIQDAGVHIEPVVEPGTCPIQMRAAEGLEISEVGNGESLYNFVASFENLDKE